MSTMELKDVSVAQLNAHIDVNMYPLRTTLMMPAKDVYDVEMAIGRILPTVQTVVVGLRGSGSATVTLQGNGTIAM